MKREQPDSAGSERSGIEMMHSLAYRRHRENIWQGKPSDKYKRLLPHIQGERIVEIGSAEGVLALMLAQRENTLVAAVERHQQRHIEACRLKSRWRELGKKVDGCRMVLGDIKDHLNLLDDADTLVAIRCIYYLKHDIDHFFAEVASRRVEHIVLCGNPGRAARYFAASGKPADKLGRFNFYASIEGMREVLMSHGYKITKEIKQGDPIVVGIRDDLGSNP
jgi:hypothetical protein